MNVAARVGIAAATAGAVGFGAYKLTEASADRIAGDKAKLDQQVAEQGAAWDSWSAKYQDAFPGGRLETPADHARLDQFLRDNPAPSWVDVDHADYTRARLSIGGDVVEPDLLPQSELGKLIGYGAIGAIGCTVMGGATAIAALRGGGGSTLANVGKLVGGAAMATTGVAMVPMLFTIGREAGNADGYFALKQRVRTEMQ